MPDLPHLALPRAEFELPRKKTGFGRPPSRVCTSHGRALQKNVEDVLFSFRRRRRPAGIDPGLILRVQLHRQAGLDEEAWERAGLALLSSDENKTLVLFSSDAELSEFRRRLREYQAGPRPGKKGAPHQQLFASIDEIGEVRPDDRIGRLFRTEGVETAAAIDDEKEYVIDVELWDLGTRDVNRAKVAEIRRLVEEQGGRVTDDYVGESMVLLRCRCSGRVIKDLLDVDYVAVVDLPPRTSLSVSRMLDIGLEDLPAVKAPHEDAPGIAVLDSGISSGHPLIRPAVGEATAAPQSLGDSADRHGHGTMVAGLALYGDVEACIKSRSFVPRLTLYSARVLNEKLEFDDESLITTQMREAIQYFRQTYGCRVFNLSLGDKRLPYQGGKVSPWASVLDTLARELDVVIVVSAGNYEYDPGDCNSADGHVWEYPRYLLDGGANIIEPATGSIVLTVGALAGRSNVPPGAAENNVALRPIAHAEQPSPFTRCGPGLGGAIKPELCEVGGNLAFDGLMHRPREVRELSVVSMNREYVRRLFTTDIGTSFAAPRVAHMAARLFESFPNASANLIRALLAASASVPEPAERILRPLGNAAVLRVCGYGRPDLRLAQSSSEARVVLYAEAELDHDKFHIYEMPIPNEFIDTKGLRRITVTLAYDPPVRHTRIDYLGVKMSFRLIRGKTVNEIAEAFRQRGRSEHEIDRLTSTRYDCGMVPGPKAREGGTLQKGVFTIHRRPPVDYGDTYYLVVRCEKKWAGEEYAPQRYAIVVVVEHSAQVDLYSVIRARVERRLRVRQRARG